MLILKAYQVFVDGAQRGAPARRVWPAPLLQIKPVGQHVLAGVIGQPGVQPVGECGEHGSLRVGGRRGVRGPDEASIGRGSTWIK